MLKKLMLVAALVVGIGGALVLPAQSASAVHEGQGLEEHCPDYNGHPGKVEASGNPASADETIVVDGKSIQVVVDGKNVSFFEGGEPVVVEFCIKASDLAGGKETGSTGTVTWVNHGGQTPDISYVVVYSVPQPVIPVNGDDEEDEEEREVGGRGGAEKEVEQVDAPKVAAVDAGAGPAVGSAVLGLFTSLTAVVGVATRKLSAIFES